MLHVSRSQNGQAIIALVMIIAIVTIIFTQIAFLNLDAVAIANEQTESELLRITAEGYAENAALRYLRDSAYAGETLSAGDISCTILVTDLGGGIDDIEVTCTRSGRSKTVGLQATYASGIFQFSKLLTR